MRVSLAYGKGRLSVEAPDSAVVITPAELPGLPDEHAAFTSAVRQPIGARPLRDVVPPQARIAIVVADITRPSPSERLVPWLLDELAPLGRDQIVILVGTGSHRPNTPDELQRMLGDEVVDTVRVVNHNGFDASSLKLCGTTSYGGEVWINRDYLEADFRIATGFIEPHFYAGFSGGPKGIVPGLAGIQTIMHLHNAEMIGHPGSTWAQLTGNPVQGEIREAVAMAPPEFLVNVALNQQRAITGLWAGHYLHAHEVGCRFVAEHATCPVTERFDVVLTSNSGYPLDQNLYQTTKGMSAAARLVKPGGAILVASECSEGLPSHGNFQQLLQMQTSPRALLDMIQAPGFSMYDQWAAQSLALVREQAEVYLYSALDPDMARRALLTPVRDIGQALQELLARAGPQARLAVLPEGPQTVPYVAGSVPGA